MYTTCARLGNRAFAPAGAAVTITGLSFLSASEKATAQASNRLVSKRLTRWMIQQKRSFASEASKTAESVAKGVPKDAATPKQGFSVMQWYEGHLQARPVPTKMLTGAFLWGVGDAVAQYVPNWAAGKPMPSYDWPRTGRAAFFGFALHAPLSHVHFNFLEWMTVKGGFQGLQIPVFKTVMEQVRVCTWILWKLASRSILSSHPSHSKFIYWSWLSNSLYHGAMGAMQGQNLEQIYNKIADVLWETQV